jgi:hypothetical protein
MDFSGGSPETTKTSVSQESTPLDSLSPAPTASPSPKSRGPKPSPTDRTRVVWEGPPPLIPAAAEAANPKPMLTPSLKRTPVAKHREKISTHVALVSESGNTKKRKAVPSPSPAATLDAAKARTELKERGRAKEEALKLEKEQIENGIKNSAGSVREQWKYRMAVLREQQSRRKRL